MEWVRIEDECKHLQRKQEQPATSTVEQGRLSAAVPFPTIRWYSPLATAATGRALTGPVVGCAAFEAPVTALALAAATSSLAVAAGLAATIPAAAAPAVVTVSLGGLLGGLTLLAAGGLVLKSLRSEELLLPRRELEPGAAVAARQLLVEIGHVGWKRKKIYTRNHA
jgi:hypothetical protein